MLSKLPITLAQLKVGNNSGKVINEIRQLLYLLCHSKKLSETIQFEEHYLKNANNLYEP